ncbi:DMT family transporter [Shewanella sp. CG12_big_fil_rev_8_21_14_0_65_47_15]|uniref:DMT family transporter n=1 Tax=Shewanella sp. CG12_big_fil_rev_8_21_14_0_65_47_15 TaxID=1975537 RepID=UPI000CC60826|nr:DMT family transporter [Shewanella sp. CG12_big_fil_rev_8_21_14_0_65_47_15]PIW59091.1 MAG: EamA/RhaT family transporter [Shewanella sp. CG12_big_fil_rev_8_21_14_0_65_47_15]
MPPLLMILAAQLLIASGNLLVKLLETDAPVFQLVLYRQLFATLLVLPFVWRLQGNLKLSPFYKVHLARALLIGLGNAIFMLAIMHLPLATVTAVIYTSPLLLLVLSALFLNERIGYRRTVAGIIGFSGILLISQPSEFNLYIGLAFFGAMTSALNSLILKAYSTHEHPFSMLFWSNAFAMIFLIPATLYEGADFSVSVAQVGLTLGLFYIGMTYLIIHAYRRADASQMAPVEYTGLIFAALLGWWVLDEELSLVMLTGIGLVIFSSILPSYSELKAKWKSRRS